MSIGHTIGNVTFLSAEQFRRSGRGQAQQALVAGGIGGGLTAGDGMGQVQTLGACFDCGAREATCVVPAVLEDGTPIYAGVCDRCADVRVAGLLVS